MTTLLFCFFLITLLYPSTVLSKEKIQTREDGIYVENITSQNLEKYFTLFDYTDYLYRDDWKYPPIFLKTMPVDFDKIENLNQRNNLFIRILAPIAMKINEDISLEKADILIVKDKLNNKQPLTETDKKLLEEKAKKYDIFTRTTGDERYDILLNQLGMKVDELPVSILISVSAMETEWGTSKYLKQGNSLYKEKIWYSNEGMEVVEDSDDKDYRIKSFKSLYDSMYSFALKVNSDINYTDFRFLRNEERSRDKYLNGRFLAHNFYFHAPLENFAGMLDYTITFYEMTNLDDAKLEM